MLKILKIFFNIFLIYANLCKFMQIYANLYVIPIDKINANPTIIALESDCNSGQLYNIAFVKI